MDFHYGKHAKKIVHDFAAAYLKERGYRKRAANFTHTGSSLIQTINIQSSPYNDEEHYDFMINIGISPHSYKEKHCPPGLIFTVQNHLLRARYSQQNNLKRPEDVLKYCEKTFIVQLEYLTELHKQTDLLHTDEALKDELRDYLLVRKPLLYGHTEIFPYSTRIKRWLEIDDQ